MKKTPVSILVFLIILDASSFTQTNISEGIVHGTWEINSSPYHIHGNITIPNDSSLIIEPGVKVEFQGHYSLTVLGRLLAIGTEKDSILFTATDTTGFSDPTSPAGGWYGIRFIDTTPNNDSSKIVHCRLEYGKAVGPVWHMNAGGAVCVLKYGKVLISSCLIINNSAVSTSEEPSIGGGLYFFKSNIVLMNNTFVNNNASYGGAIFFDDSDPVFKDNLIKNNYATSGAGISMGGTCHPEFTNDRIINNFAESHGGGMLFQYSDVVCEGLTVKGNRALWGGGIGVQGGKLTAKNCNISNNYAEIWGGGIAGDFATFHLDACTFSKDTSEWGSGGLHMDHSQANLLNCLFSENSAFFGGGFHAVFSKITSKASHFIENHAGGGGGIHVENSDCILDECLFSRNQANNGNGGAIEYTADSTIFGRKYRFFLTGSNIENNTSSVNSGAMRIEQTGQDFSLLDLVIDSCEVKGNHSDAYGTMRIAGHLKDFKVSNCIFENNTSTHNTAGPAFVANSEGEVYNCIFRSNYSSFTDSTKIYHGCTVFTEAEVEFFNCIFSDTSNAPGIGLSLRRGGKADVTNCIFWGSGYNPVNLFTAAGLGCSVNINYCNVEFGIDSISINDSLSILNWGYGNISENPLFVNEKNGDFHLQDESPCIGSGINSFILNDHWLTAPTRDMEGNPRPSPHNSQADMGVYEHILGAPLNTGMKHAIASGELIDFVVYPNPFHHTANFKYELTAPCPVNLDIYNFSGKKIATLVSGNQTAGKHMIDWDASRYLTGHYFYRFITGNGNSTSGILILF